MSGRDTAPAMAEDTFEVEDVDAETPLDETPDDDLAVDRHGDIDTTLRMIAKECTRYQKRTRQESLITIRVQPGLMRPAKDGKWNYVGWRGLRWFVSVRTVAGGQAFRRTMDEFFQAVQRCGFAQVERTLKGLEKQQ